ncbi:Uncharacterized protein OBRU01_24658 [Operophtera brumata]|uniref:Uncharacterized protein n=1 Tax=Operophtera brumata TaxID=104452 RepID=A0A0L7KM39_OPEBR|nr:Uncharacterized protein OBRU01_24658 [Operophtera brumata]
MLRDPDVFAFNALFMEHGQAGAGHEPGAVQRLLSRRAHGTAPAHSHPHAAFSARARATAIADRSYTALDCVWLLYCRNLAVTSELSPPYGTLARING